MFSQSLFALLTSFCLVSAVKNTIYIISEAESSGRDLTPIGSQRANECIPQVFSRLDVGLVISCAPSSELNECYGSVATATPLANSLGLQVDTSCGVGEEADDECMTSLIDKWGKNSTKSIVIVWDNAEQDTLFENMGIDPPGDDEAGSGTSHDLITTVQDGKWVGQESQNCTGIDGPAPAPGTGGSDTTQPVTGPTNEPGSRPTNVPSTRPTPTNVGSGFTGGPAGTGPTEKPAGTGAADGPAVIEHASEGSPKVEGSKAGESGGQTSQKD